MATTPTIPRTTLGHVDDATYGLLLGEALEHVADCVWPLSVTTYAQMRRDPQIKAVLDAYQLLIRRATWAVDPAGCRPEVARLVADDLGLPLAGQDQPGAARVRGVSWRDHLRVALNCLTFGHAGFEMQADTSSGRARLVGLWERQPWTINQIHSDPKTGALTGISQSGAWRQDAPQIKSDRLVWYVHEREGSNWAGVSLLRPAFGPALIKKELVRVLATSNRRFSMGVPTVEWAVGSNPTPQQMSQAQQLASAARVGDQSGASLPAGASLILRGLSGSVPDTLSFLKWIDSQISGMALARFMDLGDSSNGSRALGESFVDFFTLAVQSCADDIADQVTRQAAARLVEWNFGADEPVPAVRVADVRSRREVTAEALKTLLDSGVLDADPALKEYVRREWRLPQQEAPSPPAPVPTATPPVPANPPVAASTARPRSRRKQASNQPALFAAADDPEPVPTTDFAALQEQWQTARDELMAQWPEAAEPMVDDLTAQVEEITAAEDLGALGTLVVSAAVVTALTGLLTDAGISLAATAALGVVAEAAAQGVTVTVPDDAGVDRVTATAMALAGVIAAGYATGAARAALMVAGPDADSATVGAAVREHLTELGTSGNGWVADNVGASLSAAQNAGRAAVTGASPPRLWIAAEVNDRNQCKPCSDIDGQVFSTRALMLAAYPNELGHVGCLGGLRCRGIAAPIWN